MPENTPRTLSCPSCGAPLEYDGLSTFVRCKFCKTTSVMPGAPEKQSTLTQDALDEVRALAQGGNMLEAIRRFRDLTGVDLKSAKTSVEFLSSGRVMVASNGISGPLTPEQTGQILEQVQELLRADNKVEAVRRYREAADVSQTRASHVVDQVEAALKGLPAPQVEQILGQVASYTPTRLRKTTSWVGAIVGLSILLFIAGMVSLFILLPGGPLNALMVANGPVVLSNPGTASPVLAGVFYDVNAENRQVVVLDPVSGRMLWKSESLPGDGFTEDMILTDDLVIAASVANLLAYHLEDGSLAWNTAMPDRLNYAENVLALMGGRVLTNTADQSIQAYDLVTGRLVWSRQMGGYDRTLRDLAGSLVVMDYALEEYTYSLVFLDPLTGEEKRILTPTCSADGFSTNTIDPDSGLLFDLASNAMYLVYDSSPGCIQRIDLSSGQPVWQTIDEEWYSFSSDGFTGFLAGDDLVFSSGSRLLSINTVDGSLKVLFEDDEYEILPLFEQNEALVVRLRRTRGTEHFELRGLESGSGSLLWQKDMGAAKPIDPPDAMAGLIDEGYPGFTWRLSTRGLILAEFQAIPNQLVIQTIDYTDGSLSARVVIPLKVISGDFYSIPEVMSWQDELLYLSVDGKILCINHITGEVLFHFK